MSESAALEHERVEQRRTRDAQDAGGRRRVNGEWIDLDDLPEPDSVNYPER